MFKDENVSLTSSVQNIKDISKVFTDFTQSFTVPGSKVNNLIFKHWYKPEIDGFDARTRKTATMELNFQPFKTGRIQLNKVQKKNGVISNYQLTFFGDVVQITDLMGEDKLTDLDLSAYQHDFTDDNTEDGLRGGFLLGAEVIYPLISSERVWTWGDASATDISWGSKGASSGIRWNELKPAIKIQKIIDAIKTKYSLVFSDHFFNTTDFLKLWMWASREKGNMSAYGESNILTFVRTAGTPLADTQNYTTEEAKEKVTITVTPAAGFEEVPYTIVRDVYYSDTGNTITTKFSRVGTGENIVTKQAAEGFKTITYYIEAGEAFDYSVDILAFRFATATDWEASTGAESATGTVNFTDFVDTNGNTQLGQLPEIRCVDFFKGLLQMFNLVVVPDNGTFIVQAFDDWMENGEVKDISRYIDLSSEEVNRTNLYKKIDFNYQEPETIIQDNFNNTNGRFIGDLEYESDVDGDNFEIELPFENLVGGLITDTADDSLTNVRTYTVIDKDLEPVKIKPFIFYYTNTNTAPTTSLTLYDEAAAQIEVTGYNEVGQENGATDDLITHSLNWGSEISTYFLSEMTNSLFNDYWSTYITDIFDEKRRMFKFKGILPPGVLANLKLNDKLIVNNRRFLINQFTSNLLTGEVQFELLNDVQSVDIIESNNKGLQYELQEELTG